MRVAILCLILLSACGPRSPKDCRKEGEGVVRRLIHELEQIETRDDLCAHQDSLASLYLDLAEVMIRAERASSKWIERPEAMPIEENDRLKRELVRIYRIPGGREVVETAQAEALYQLDNYFEKRDSA